jgi:hypothetical protein
MFFDVHIYYNYSNGNSDPDTTPDDSAAHRLAAPAPLVFDPRQAAY